MSGAQLFVGRLAKDVRARDLEDIFSRYGTLARCDIKSGSALNYAFVDFEDKRDAEDAMRREDGRELCGSHIVVEQSKGPNYRFHPSGGYYGNKMGSGRRLGGFYDDYRDRRRSRSRSRSRSRRRRTRSRSRRRRYSKSRSRSRSYRKRRDSRTRSRSRSYRRSRSRDEKRHHRSRSDSRSRSRDRRDKSKSKERSESKHKSRSKSRSPTKSKSADGKENGITE